MNQTIVATLRDHADGDVHVERLLSAVHAGARRRRRQRLAATGSAVVTVVALVAATGVAYLQRPTMVAGPSLETAFPRPPLAQGVPTVAQSPVVFGTDPSLFHLDLADLSGAKALSWDARDGHEELAMTLESGDVAMVVADRDRSRLGWPDAVTTPATVAGMAAEALDVGTFTAVRWEPLAGIWVQAQTTRDLAATIRVAEQLRFDRVYRCAVPFQLEVASPVRLGKCTTYLNLDPATGRWAAGGGAWFTVGDSPTEYQVAVGGGQEPVTVNDTIAGRAVEIIQPRGDIPFEIRYPYDGRTAHFWVWEYGGPVDQAFVRSLVTAFVPVPGDDPNAWPITPFTR